MARIRRGEADEPEDRAARYLIDELQKAVIRDPESETLSTRHDELVTALQAVCARLGIPWKPAYPSLRAWGRSSGIANLDSLARKPIARKQFEPLLDALDAREGLFEPVEASDPPDGGWESIDAKVKAIRDAFVLADSSIDYGNMARQCRDIFVDLAAATYREDAHGPLPEPVPGQGGGDVKRRLTAFVRSEVQGGHDEVMRGLATKALDLANVLQHRQGVERWEAANLADSTILVVRLFRRLARCRPTERVGGKAHSHTLRPNPPQPLPYSTRSGL